MKLKECKSREWCRQRVSIEILLIFQGAGQSHINGANGGSQGSRGGQGSALTSVAMATSDIYSRGLWGSGGGLSGTYSGGRGGGYLHVDTPTLTLTGLIMCDGNNAGVGGNFKLCDPLSQQEVQS